MKIRHLVICVTLFFSSMTLSFESKAMDPRMKALGTMAVYGTVGGALLGTASLAFGTGGRSVAIGASLGLYAGLIFGSYVVVTHEMKKNQYKGGGDYYPDTPGGFGPYDGGSSNRGQGHDDQQTLIWNGLQEIESSSQNFKVSLNSGSKNEKVFGIPLLNYQF